MLQPLVEVQGVQDEFEQFHNFFRGEYRIFRNTSDVAKRNKVNFNRKSTDEQVEQYLLQLFNDSQINASDED